VNFRQFNRQLPLAALAQEVAKQRVIAEPFAGIVHPLQEQP
jgi:HAMP domain-containing protein